MRRLRHILASALLFMTGAVAQDQLDFIKLPSAILSQSASSQQSVKDGDSLIGQSADGFEINIRLAHIDTPETHQGFGDAATQELSRLCLGKMAQLSGTQKDGFGRLLAELSCDNIDVNQHMIETGHAWVYDKYNSRLTFPALEKSAAENCAGLWGAKGAQPPWVYRKKGADKYAETSQAQIAARTARCARITLAAR